MPLNQRNTRTFHRTLFAGSLECVRLLKRANDQAQGTVVSHEIYQCHWGWVQRTGEPILGEITSRETRRLFVPQVELDRVGVEFISAADRFIDQEGRTWQPESDTNINEAIFGNQIVIDCRRTNDNNKM